jgi:hypothetical protein
VTQFDEATKSDPSIPWNPVNLTANLSDLEGEAGTGEISTNIEGAFYASILM